MALAPVAEAWDLPRVGARPHFGAYVAEVWRRRHFIGTMARYRMRAGVEANRLGMAWIVLRPLINAGIYGVIFGLLQGGNRPDDFPAFVVIGVFFFEFFQGCFNDGSKAISNNRSLVQSLSFPRMTLPLALAVERLLQFFVMVVVMLLMLVLLGHAPSLSWFAVIPLIALFTLFNTGVAFITARLTVHVSDLTQLLPFVSRIMFYTSGVLFGVSTILKDHPGVLVLYDYFPLYQVLEMARHHLIGAEMYPMRYWWLLTASSLLTFVGGALFFWQAEERYGRD
ncbi:ABC transporter permease [Tessaracoccus sp. Y1736]